MRTIYLDNAANTPLHPQVAKVMNIHYARKYGNASSGHLLGEYAQESMQASRKILAHIIRAKPWELVFTSGGTEANNLIIQGVSAAQPRRRKIVISAIEHSSVWDVALALQSRGYQIISLPVDSHGRINIKQMRENIGEDTALVSVMHMNNELGSVQDLSSIGLVCKGKGVYFHTDAVQSFGKLALNVNDMHIDLLTASAHKVGGPQGTGFAFIREGIAVSPLIIGGRQERGLRAGTENVAGIVGFAEAAKITAKKNYREVLKLREYFLKELENIGAEINSSRQDMSGILNVSFPGVDGELLATKLSQAGVMCSIRSACLSGLQKENRVLNALGLSQERIRGAIRLSLGSQNTRKDIQEAIEIIGKSVKNMQKLQKV